MIVTNSPPRRKRPKKPAAPVEITASIFASGAIQLAPPGLTITVEDLYA